MSKKMIAAGNMRGKISMKTRAVELIQEAAEHLKDARGFLVEWGKFNRTGLFGADLNEISGNIDDINENLISMVGELTGSTKNYDDDDEENNEDEEKEEDEDDEDDEEE